MEKLVFGTAAFAKSYGLCTSHEPEHWKNLVRQAVALGVQRFDTAPAYGDAECILTEALEGSAKIWTKCSGLDFKNQFMQGQLEFLQFHNWERCLLNNPGWIDTWQSLRQQYGCKLGATTYGIENPKAAIESGLFDIVQIEWNILNQSVLKAVSDQAKRNRVLIAVRSIYLQGLLTDRSRHLTGYPVLQGGIQQAQALALRWGFPLEELVLRAVQSHAGIDYCVIGFEWSEQIQMAVGFLKQKELLNEKQLADLAALDLAGHPETDPRNWKLESVNCNIPS